jgi:hypothetical protein
VGVGSEGTNLKEEDMPHLLKTARVSKWAHRYADRVATADTLGACSNGHADCALVEGGHCLDEVLTEHEAHVQATGLDCPECE